MATVTGIGSVWSLLKESAGSATPSATAATWAAGIATLTFGTAHNLVAGQQITIAGWAPAPWNGTWRVSSISSSTVALVEIPFDPGASTSRSSATPVAYGNLASSGTPRHVPLVSESLDIDPARVDLSTLSGGSVVESYDSWRSGRRAVEGGVQTFLWDSGASLLWEAILGSVATSGPVASRYTHVFTPARVLPSYTVRVGMGGSSSVPTKTMTGAKVKSAQISASADGAVGFGVDWVGRELQLVSPATLAGALPAGQQAYQLQDSFVRVSGAGGPSGCVKGFDLQIDNQLAAEFCTGSPWGKEPERNGPCLITGSLDVTFDTADQSYFYDRFVAGTALAVNLFFGISGASPYEQLAIDLNCRIDGGTPQVTGAEKLQIKVPIKALVVSGSVLDSSAITVTAINADSTP